MAGAAFDVTELIEAIEQVLDDYPCWEVRECRYECPVCGVPRDGKRWEGKEWNYDTGQCLISDGDACDWAAKVLRVKKLVEELRAKNARLQAKNTRLEAVAHVLLDHCVCMSDACAVAQKLGGCPGIALKNVLATEGYRSADIEKRAREIREVLNKALECFEGWGTEYRNVLGKAGLLSPLLSNPKHYRRILSDDAYDGEAIAFALRVVDKILDQGETKCRLDTPAAPAPNTGP